MNNNVLNQYIAESNRTSTFATGFVRPKTTALFFEKLWAPYDIRISHYGRKFDMYSIPEEICLTGNDVGNKQLFDKMEQRLNGVMTSKSLEDSGEEYALYGFRKMLLSENRNQGLLYCSRVFQKYFGIHVVPILIDKTRYESEIARHNRTIFNDSKYIGAEGNVTNRVERATLELTIHALPMAIEEKLDWQQVQDFRNDKNEIEKLRRFLRWLNGEFANKSKDQIENELGQMLDGYKASLRKHGVEIISSGVTTVISTSATLFGAIGNLQSAGLAVGLTVSAGLITYFVNSMNNYVDLQREPIAYIYDVINETDKWWSKKK